MALDPITGGEELATSIANLIGKFIKDPNEAAQQELQLALKELTNQAATDAAQAAINNTEAAAPGWFRGGWRPFMGWVCDIAFAWNYVLCPVLTWFLMLWGADVRATPLDMSVMMPVLIGMLGLGGARTFEKTKGVS